LIILAYRIESRNSIDILDVQGLLLREGIDQNDKSGKFNIHRRRASVQAASSIDEVAKTVEQLDEQKRNMYVIQFVFLLFIWEGTFEIYSASPQPRRYWKYILVHFYSNRTIPIFLVKFWFPRATCHSFPTLRLQLNHLQRDLIMEPRAQSWSYPSPKSPW
jgi:hypothetical protein